MHDGERARRWWVLLGWRVCGASCREYETVLVLEEW